MGVLFLFILAFFVMFVSLIPNSRPYRRTKTDREEALHNHVQRAMNWSPNHAHLCEDGKYRDSYGNEYVKVSLKEILEAHDKLFPGTKHIIPEDAAFVREMNRNKPVPHEFEKIWADTPIEDLLDDSKPIKKDGE